MDLQTSIFCWWIIQLLLLEIALDVSIFFSLEIILIQSSYGKSAKREKQSKAPWLDTGCIANISFLWYSLINRNQKLGRCLLMNHSTLAREKETLFKNGQYSQYPARDPFAANQKKKLNLKKLPWIDQISLAHSAMF